MTFKWIHSWEKLSGVHRKAKCLVTLQKMNLNVWAGGGAGVVESLTSFLAWSTGDSGRLNRRSNISIFSFCLERRVILYS